MLQLYNSFSQVEKLITKTNPKFETLDTEDIFKTLRPTPFPNNDCPIYQSEYLAEEMMKFIFRLISAACVDRDHPVNIVINEIDINSEYEWSISCSGTHCFSVKLTDPNVESSVRINHDYLSTPVYVNLDNVVRDIINVVKHELDLIIQKLIAHYAQQKIAKKELSAKTVLISSTLKLTEILKGPVTIDEFIKELNYLVDDMSKHCK